MNRPRRLFIHSLALIASGVLATLHCALVLATDDRDGVVYVPLPVRAAVTATPRRSPEPYQQDIGYRIAIEGSAPALAPAPVFQPSDVKPFDREITAAARDAGVEPALVHAVVAVESAYRPHAISPKGAIGLMQVMPGTAQRYGINNPAEVHNNLRAGSRHLRMLIDMFGERLDLVLAAYNAGEGAVRKHNNSIPPYRETRGYVPAVMRKYKPAKPVPLPPLQVSLQRDYMPGTRMESDALARLP